MVAKKIAEACGVEIFADPSWVYSFFSSPYPAHRMCSAVDIYQGEDFGGPALSPAEGKVFKVLEFESPSLGESLPEYLILIESGDLLVRIMHVDPKVKEGDVVSFGDVLGSFIPSGYFSYFVDPHIHLEVRGKDDFLRARGCLELTPFVGEPQGNPSLSGVVVKSDKRNAVVELNGVNLAEVDGRKVFVDGSSCLECGGVCGVFQQGKKVFFDGVQIGTIVGSGEHMSVFSWEDLYVSADSVSFAGISFMFGAGSAFLIPEGFGASGLEAGQKVKIELVKK